MANPFYQMLMGNQMPVQQAQPQVPMQMSGGPMFQNPMQKMQYIMQAMTNPAAFVKRTFPDIPDGISNDPNQILGYLQQTRGITNEQIQQAQQSLSQMPFMRR